MPARLTVRSPPSWGATMRLGCRRATGRCPLHVPSSCAWSATPLRSSTAITASSCASADFSGQRGSREGRSEEHTSELQSLMRISYAVFCLKKKIKIHNHNTHHRLQHTENSESNNPTICVDVDTRC